MLSTILLQYTWCKYWLHIDEIGSKSYFRTDYKLNLLKWNKTGQLLNYARYANNWLNVHPFKLKTPYFTTHYLRDNLTAFMIKVTFLLLVAGISNVWYILLKEELNPSKLKETSFASSLLLIEGLEKIRFRIVQEDFPSLLLMAFSIFSLSKVSNSLSWIGVETAWTENFFFKDSSSKSNSSWTIRYCFSLFLK